MLVRNTCPANGDGMKTALYDLVAVEYDETAPCWCCGEPVGEASMAGTVVCPACDCGYHRDGRKWTFAEAAAASARFVAEEMRVR